MNSSNSLKSRIRLTAVCVWLLLAGVVAGCKWEDSAAGGASPASPNQSAGLDYFKTHFQTEAQFVVENITADIAEMVCFARNHRLPETKAFSVDAEETGGTPDAPVYKVTVNLHLK